MVLPGLGRAAVFRDALVLIGPLVDPELGIGFQASQVCRTVRCGTVGIRVFHRSIRLGRRPSKFGVQVDQAGGIFEHAPQGFGQPALHFPGIRDGYQLPSDLGGQPEQQVAEDAGGAEGGVVHGLSLDESPATFEKLVLGQQGEVMLAMRAVALVAITG
ncbi:hypothetical protein D9M69_585830 [compost metagenome]